NPAAVAGSQNQSRRALARAWAKYIETLLSFASSLRRANRSLHLEGLANIHKRSRGKTGICGVRSGLTPKRKCGYELKRYHHLIGYRSQVLAAICRHLAPGASVKGHVCLNIGSQ